MGDGLNPKLHRSSPSISAIPFEHSGTGRRAPLLSEAERRRLASIATVVRFERGQVLYEQEDELSCIYNLAHGVVRTCCTSSDGRRTLTAFLFPEDLVGLAENGRYTATAEAVTPVTAYRLPIPALESLLQQNPELELHFLCKVCHELRQAQRHAVLLARHDALGKVALFLHLLLYQQGDPERDRLVLDLPMKRADIADYTGLSVEAVSRSFRALERRGVLRLRGSRVVEIVDRHRFDRLLEAPLAKQN